MIDREGETDARVGARDESTGKGGLVPVGATGQGAVNVVRAPHVRRTRGRFYPTVWSYLWHAKWGVSFAVFGLLWTVAWGTWVMDGLWWKLFMYALAGVNLIACSSFPWTYFRRIRPAQSRGEEDQ